MHHSCFIPAAASCLGPACRDTVGDFQNILGALYLAVLFLGIINAMSVQSVVFFQRSVRPCLVSVCLRHCVLSVADAIQVTSAACSLLIAQQQAG